MNPDKGDYFSEYHVPEEYEFETEDVCGCESEGCSDCESFWLSQLTDEQKAAHRKASRLEQLAHDADLRGEWELAADLDKQAQACWEVVYA